MLAGFVGILVMVQPQGGNLSTGHLAALGTVFTGAAITLILRRIGREEQGASIVLSVILWLLLVSLPVTSFVLRPMPLADVGLLAASGTLMGTAQVVMLRAFRLAPASSVAPMQYTMMLWALLYGTVIFADPVRPHMLAGAAIVIASSLYILHRERVRGAA